MTLPFDSLENAGGLSDRRLYSRGRVEQTIYIKVGEGNGGFILNISEGGLAVQTAMPLVDDHLSSIRFHFSKSRNWIEASGAVAWRSESRKMAGVKFVNLPEESRAQIKEWISWRASGVPISREEGSLSTLGPRPNVPNGDTGKGPEQGPAENDSDGNARDQGSNSPPDTIVLLPPGQRNGEPHAPVLGVANAPDDMGPRNDARTMPATPGPEKPEPRKLDGSPTRRTRISRALLKRYLVDERHRIRLYDLVSEQAEKLSNELTEANFPSNAPVTDSEFMKRVHRYEELTEELISIFITGCFWGEKNQQLIWVKLLERVANAAGGRTGHPQWLALQSYPALLLFYAGGLAAIANEKYTTLEGLLVKPRLIGPDGDCRLVDKLSAAAVIEDERLIKMIGGGVCQAALSTYLCAFLRERFREFVPSDDVYDEIFDHFEYMFALVWIDENPVGASLGWVPLGRFAWRHLSGLQYGANIVGRISAEVSQQGKDWPVFRAGLFGGSMQRFVSARNRVATFMASQQ